MDGPPFDHEYPPESWTVEEIADALRSAEATPPVPTYDDAEVWSEIRVDSACQPVVETIVEEAESVLEADIPAYPASLYLDYVRVDGMSQRKVMEPTLERARRLSVVALAECFEREGRFEDAILDHAWALCEQSTWLHPANLSETEDVEGLPVTAPPDRRNVALRPAGIAKALGELVYVFDGRLHPALRDRIRDAVEYRVLEPYEARDDFWWMKPPANNWNAVCNSGSAMAAMYLVDDPDRIARFVVEAAHNMRHYLRGFDPDGCTPEGIGYWNYGFGNYAQFAAQLEALTGGEYSLVTLPVVREIAQFPLRIELSPGRYPAFSDATEQKRVDPFTACWLGQRLDLPGLAAFGREALDASSIGRFPDTLRNLLFASRTPSDWVIPEPEPSVHLRGHDWWIARVDPGSSDGLVVAAKGGHNDEPHNHNDVGTFVYHVGNESLLTDLGTPVYDNEYFGEGRYEFLAARSLGHNLPYVDGVEQAAGREYTAEVVDRSVTSGRASFGLELTGCYPDEAGLTSLRRTFTLDRSNGGRLTVEDVARFEADGDFQSILVSFFPIDGSDDGLVVTGERGRATVVLDVSDGHDVERLENAIDTSERADVEANSPDVWRARIRATTDTEAVVRYTIEPT